MSDDLTKFIFLGAMILLAVLAKQGDVGEQPALVAGLGALSAAEEADEPPLLVLEPPGEEDALFSGAGSQTAGRESAAEKKNAGITVEELLSSPDLLAEASGAGENTFDDAGTPRGESHKKSGFIRSGTEDPPRIGAAAGLVADLRQSGVFFALWQDKRWPTASVTKLVSAAVASRGLRMNREVELLGADFSPANGAALKEGERYAVRDLVVAALLRSSNEAAEALARIYPGERSAFVSAMNEIAADWGLKETHFDDPTGLSAANQSTAKEIARLALRVYDEHPEILRITREEGLFVTELNSGNKILLKNINFFASWPDFLGGKTGFTDEAGGNLLTVFGHNGKQVVIIVLGSDDRFGDTERLLNWFKRNFK